MGLVAFQQRNGVEKEVLQVLCELESEKIAAGKGRETVGVGRVKGLRYVSIGKD